MTVLATWARARNLTASRWWGRCWAAKHVHIYYSTRLVCCLRTTFASLKTFLRFVSLDAPTLPFVWMWCGKLSSSGWCGALSHLQIKFPAMSCQWKLYFEISIDPSDNTYSKQYITLLSGNPIVTLKYPSFSPIFSLIISNDSTIGVGHQI